MQTFTTLKPGFYQINYPTGKIGFQIRFSEKGKVNRVTLPINTPKAIAEKKYHQIMKDVALRKLGEHEHTSDAIQLRNMKISEFKDWLIDERYRNNSSPATLKGNLNQVKYLSDFIDHNIRLADISDKTIAEYVEHQRNRGLSPSGINKYLSELRKIFNLAIKSNLIKSNPVQSKHFQKPGVMKVVSSGTPLISIGIA